MSAFCNTKAVTVRFPPQENLPDKRLYTLWFLGNMVHYEQSVKEQLFTAAVM